MTAKHEPHKRPRQIADLIHRELATILKRETNDVRLNQLLITEVDVNPDLRVARIYFTLLDSAQLEETQRALTKGTGFLRQRLAERVALRYVPKLLFKFDDNLERAEHLSSLLNKIKPEDQS